VSGGAKYRTELSLLPEQSVWTFRRVMAWATLRPAQVVFDRSYRQTDLHDPAEVAKVAAAYQTLTAVPPGTPHPIEKKIWMLWQQGWDQAPELARRCAESWQQQNPGWELILLDQDSLPGHATGYAERVPQHLSRQHQADLARTMLIAEHGGVWADATLFCARPLDDWLPYAARTGFFMFAAPRPYRIVDNWFIVGARGNRAIAGMQDLFFQYWRHFDKPHHYFWMIYLIGHLFEIDPEARRIWQDTPKLSALGPLAIERHAFDPDVPDCVNELIDAALVPVHKLKHKWSAGNLAGTPLGRLTGLRSVRGTEP
jgi:Capsular polysaccharide synthesis protein